MLKTILWVVVAVVAALLTFAATKPDTFGSSRSTRIAAPQRVSAELDFSKPFEAHNLVVFTVQAQGDKASTVTRALHGPMRYLNRLVTIFFDMDKVVGNDFEAGLAHLKALAEKA
jgi:hypothetical protein